MQQLAIEKIRCPACGNEHDSALLAFNKIITYKDQKLTSAEFYHTCPDRKEMIVTDKDLIHTFITERQVKRNYDLMIQQQQQQPQQGWTINFN